MNMIHTYSRQKRLNSITVVGIILIGIITYFSAFSAPFIFDDRNHIHYNESIKSLWPPWKSMTGTNRPVTDFTLAVNFALGQFNPVGYHAVNIILHILACLILLAVMQRTFDSPKIPNPLRQHSSIIALSTTLIWLTHPLNTQAVNYIIQRAEVMMALFYLLTLYCMIRCADDKEGASSKTWGKIAIVSCLCGMGSKEVMGTAPIVIIIYDRIFLASSWKEIFHRRGWVYAGLALSWILLAILIMTPRTDDTIAGPAFGLITPFQYLRAQSIVIIQYLRLAFSPSELCFFYSWPLVYQWQYIWPYTATIIFLTLLIVFCLKKIPALGFIGIWFFLVLAPSSSFVPIGDLMVEHRMYLALLSPIIVTVLLLIYLVKKWTPSPDKQRLLLTAITGIMVVILGGLTIRRNQVYSSEILLWQDVLKKRPADDMVYLNLGVAYSQNEMIDKAVEYYLKAAAINPYYDKIYFNLGAAWKQLGQLDRAKAALEKAIELNPEIIPAYTLLGIMASEREDQEEALKYFKTAKESTPDNPYLLNNYGLILYQNGELEDALKIFNYAIKLDPNSVNSHYNIGLVYFELEKIEQAIEHFNKAINLDPFNVKAHYNLGTALANKGLIAESAYHFERVVYIDPEFQDAKERLTMLHQILRGQIPDPLVP